MKNNSKKVWIVLGIVFVLVLVLASVGSKKQKIVDPNNPYKLGAALALSGDAAVWGEAALNGAKLAVNEINNDGGINGRPIELIVEDMKSTNKDSVLAVSKLQDVNKVNGLMISWLDVYTGPLGNIKADMLTISPDAGVEALRTEKVYPNVFSLWYRTGPKSELAVKTMAEMGKKKLYLIGQNDPYYIGALNFMKEAAKKYGVEIVGEDLLTSDIDMKSVLLKAQQAKPDVVFFGLYDEKQYAEIIKRNKTYLGDAVLFADEFVQQNHTRKDFGENAFEGIYFYAPQQPDTKFITAYKEAYGKDPVFGAGPSYDAVKVFAEYWKENPEDINRFMLNTSFDTVTFGKIGFDEFGGVKSDNNSFVIKQIKNGIPVELN